MLVIRVVILLLVSQSDDLWILSKIKSSTVSYPTAKLAYDAISSDTSCECSQSLRYTRYRRRSESVNAKLCLTSVASEVSVWRCLLSYIPY